VSGIYKIVWFLSVYFFPEKKNCFAALHISKVKVVIYNAFMYLSLCLQGRETSRTSRCLRARASSSPLPRRETSVWPPSRDRTLSVLLRDCCTPIKWPQIYHTALFYFPEGLEKGEVFIGTRVSFGGGIGYRLLPFF